MSKYPQISWLVVLAWVSSASAGGLLSFWSNEPKRLVPVPVKATAQKSSDGSSKQDDEGLPPPRPVDDSKTAIPKPHDEESHKESAPVKESEIEFVPEKVDTNTQPISKEDELPPPRKVGEEKELSKPRKVDIKADLSKLRLERESLADERRDAARVMQNTFSADSEKLAELRLRAGELLARFSLQQKTLGGDAPAPPRINEDHNKDKQPKELESKPKPDVKGAEKEKPITSRSGPKELDANLTEGASVNNLAAAENYFRAGNHANALAAYQKVDLGGLPPDSRVMTQYMMATCLRKLGKIEEAAALFKEVTNSKGDDVVVECAQWQLNSISWRDDLQKQIKKLQVKHQPTSK
jgi:tetratricopeptide (TPR) repeat protein